MSDRSTSPAFDTAIPEWAQAFVDRATAAERETERLRAQNQGLQDLLNKAHELSVKVQWTTGKEVRIPILDPKGESK